MSAKTGQTLRAHMTVHDAKEAIAFYAKAFGATELFRLTEPSGKVGHAEIKIGDSVLMLNDEYPDFGARSPAATGGDRRLAGGFPYPRAGRRQGGRPRHQGGRHADA
jgi:PhnB protein